MSKVEQRGNPFCKAQLLESSTDYIRRAQSEMGGGRKSGHEGKLDEQHKMEMGRMRG